MRDLLQVALHHRKPHQIYTSPFKHFKRNSLTADVPRPARDQCEIQLTSVVELVTAETEAESARAAYAQAIYDYKIAGACLSSPMGRRS